MSRVLIRALLFSFVLLLTPGASSALAAGPYPPPARGGAEVSQSRVEAGECITFSGSGFAAFVDVRITDNGTFLGTARTDVNGEFTFSVCFGSDAKPGRHILRGSGLGAGGGQLTVSASVIVEGVSQRPDGAGGGDGNGDGGGLPFTGFVGPGLVLGAFALVGVGSLVVLVGGRRRRPSGAQSLTA